MQPTRTPRSPRFALLLVPALAALAAAAQETSAPPEDAAQKALEATTAEVQAEIEALRGERFDGPVKVALADAEELRRYLQAWLDEMTTPEELAADEEAAKLLGLVRADYDLMAEMLELVEAQVGGFYDPKTKGFFLMEAFQGDVGRVILAHELTHALDDQLFDIEAGLKERRACTDAQWALHAVIEGSGTAVMEKWTADHMDELDMSALMEMSTMGMEELADAPPFLWKPLVGTYLQGQKFLAKRPEGLSLSDAIRRAFTEPPESSEQVLHPERYWNAETRDHPVPVTIAPAALPEGWSVRMEDTLGEMQLALLVEPPEKRSGVKGVLSLMGARLTFAASDGWGGDRALLLAGPGDADRLMLVATIWDSEKDAEQFQGAVESQREHLLAGPADALFVERAGAQVVLALARGAGEALVEDALGWPTFGAPPSAEAGGPDGG